MSTRAVAFAILLISALPANPSGIAPRASRAEYEVTCFTESLALGASVLSRDRVRRLFGNEVDNEYVVVEVGFYSKSRSSYPVRHVDFTLKKPKSNDRVPPEHPTAVCERLSLKDRLGVLQNVLLPEVTTNHAVAGYLFFRSSAWSSGRIELDYQGNGAWLTLPLR